MLLRARESASVPCPAPSRGRPPFVAVEDEGGLMEESTEEPVGLVERVCAIDIGKAGLVVCVRIPHESKPGRRVQEVREYATTTPVLLGLADWLHYLRIELVVLE